MVNYIKIKIKIFGQVRCIPPGHIGWKFNVAVFASSKEFDLHLLVKKFVLFIVVEY